MADALVHRGLTVTVVGRSPAVLPTVDSQPGRIIESELRRKGVRVLSGTAIQGISAREHGVV